MPILMRHHCDYFNKVLFTAQGVPLQLSDDEEIFYFNRDAQFYLHLGSGVPVETEIYKSPSGFVFLTQHRLIYRAGEAQSSFTSFCVPLKEIAAVGENSTVDFVHGAYVQSLYLDFGDAQKGVFFQVLRELLGAANEPLRASDDADSLPFYSDLHR